MFYPNFLLRVWHHWEISLAVTTRVDPSCLAGRGDWTQAHRRSPHAEEGRDWGDISTQSWGTKGGQHTAVEREGPVPLKVLRRYKLGIP